jgi:hypothetical protein
VHDSTTSRRIGGDGREYFYFVAEPRVWLSGVTVSRVTWTPETRFVEERLHFRHLVEFRDQDHELLAKLARDGGRWRTLHELAERQAA